MSVLTFDVDGLLTDAIRKEGVEDFGGPGFREPLGVLCAAYEAAPLSEVGRWILRAGLVHSLRMRLRVHEWVAIATPRSARSGSRTRSWSSG